MIWIHTGVKDFLSFELGGKADVEHGTMGRWCREQMLLDYAARPQRHLLTLRDDTSEFSGISCEDFAHCEYRVF